MERWYLCGCAKVIFVQKKKSKKKIQGNELHSIVKNIKKIKNLMKITFAHSSIPVEFK